MPDEGASAWAAVPYAGEVRPEWLVLGKPHADRAKQFKPFAALRGYDELIEEVIAAADGPGRPGADGPGGEGVPDVP